MRVEGDRDGGTVDYEVGEWKYKMYLLSDDNQELIALKEKFKFLEDIGYKLVGQQINPSWGGREAPPNPDCA